MSESTQRASEIKERGYNLDIKNPNAPDDGPGDPDALLASYQTVSDEAAEIRNQLQAALADALGPK